MKRLKLLIRIINETGFMKFTISFISFIFIAAVILFFVEPSILRYEDGLWYAFVTSTTVGYGDFLAVTRIGRLISVFLTVYGLIFFGCLSGIIINYYSEVRKEN